MPLPSVIKILRLRQIILHSSPEVREITDEYTFYNDSKQSQNFIVIEAYAYKINLHIYDNDGSELPVYPNDFVRHLLGQFREEWATSLLTDINQRKRYVQIIPLPPERPIHAGEARVIRFTYQDASITKNVSRKRALLNIPKFKVQVEKAANEGFLTHILISSPADFDLRNQKPILYKIESDGSKSPLTMTDHYHVSVFNHVAEFTVPDATFPLSFDATYYIYPNRVESILFRGLFYALTAFALFAFLSVVGCLNDILVLRALVSGINKSDYILTGTIVAIYLGFFGLITNPLTHRIKLWMLFPLAVSIVTLIVGNQLH